MMARDNFLEKKRGKRPDRKGGKKEPKPNSFLIVSEGTKTEPFYFRGLSDYVNQKYGDSIQSKPVIDPEGVGRSTVRLIREAQKLEKRGNILYSQVWVVFDKDDFTDFDEAIALAHELGYHTAWNNRSFEYWIFLHFNYSDAALDQGGWAEKISKVFKDEDIDPNGYQKNNPRVFEIATQRGSLKKAIKNAERIEREHPEGTLPSKCDPCTKVHHLIQELAPYLSELLE